MDTKSRKDKNTQLFRKSKNSAEFVNENGHDIIMDIQKNRQGEETSSMENAIEQALQSTYSIVYNCNMTGAKKASKSS